MSIYIKQGVFLILILQQLNLNAKVLHVGADREYSSLTQAVSAILPGDTVLVYEGIYPGGFFAENLKGTESAPISVFASGEVIFQGGSTAWQLTDAAFVHIREFILFMVQSTEQQLAGTLFACEGRKYQCG